MSLTSLQFFCLFLLSVGIYYVVPKKYQWYALLAFSVWFFCASSVISSGIYLLVSVLTTAVCARTIWERKNAQDDSRSKRALFAGIFVNVGMLCVLKYSKFFISNLNLLSYLLHVPLNVKALDLPAPLGISFYTLQVTGYLLDVYWGRAVPQKSLLKTALFTGYFPQLTSGPVARWDELKGQLYCGHEFKWESVLYGLQRMVYGIFKKTVISARIGVMVDTVYGDIAAYNGFYIWIAALAFVMQLYTDFSGCMDIILGASECYGIVLPENFHNPFSARSVQEFWQRWHITLGAWMRDYIMYPILHSGVWRTFAKQVKKKFGKKAAKQIPSYLGMLCVWLLMGLWHGGQWKYVAGWGLWFWLCIVISQAAGPVCKKIVLWMHINTESFSWRLFQRIWVYALVSVGNMFFRMDSFMMTLRALKAGAANWNPWIFFDGSLYNLGLDVKECHLLLVSLLVMAAVRVVKAVYQGEVRQWLAQQNIVFRWACMYLLLFFIIITGYYGEAYDAADFIYAGF